MRGRIRLEAAIDEMLSQVEPADPVHLVEYVEEGSSPDSHWVYVLRPDGSRGQKREVKGRITPYPGAIFRASYDRKKWGPGQLAIIGVDANAYLGKPSVPAADWPLHGETHGMQGADRVSELHPWQWYPLRVQPDLASGDWYIKVLPGYYIADYEYRRLASTASADLSSYVPGVGSRYVTISLDASGTVVVTEGALVGSPTPADIPEPPATNWAVGVFLLDSGDSDISEAEHVEVRHLGRPTGRGAGLVDNVIVVAEAGGDYTTMQAAASAAAEGDLIVVAPGDYAENLVLGTACSLSAWGAAAPHKASVTMTLGNSAQSALVVLASCLVTGLSIDDQHTKGSGTYYAVKADTGVSVALSHCRIDVSYTGIGSPTTHQVSLAGGAVEPSVLHDCHVQGNVVLAGGTVVIDGCEIVGNVTCSAATTLYLRNSRVTGSVTGSGGTAYIYSDSSVGSTISGWSTVSYPAASVVYNSLLDAATGGSDGQVLVVQGDGKLALESLALGKSYFIDLLDTPDSWDEELVDPETDFVSDYYFADPDDVAQSGTGDDWYYLEMACRDDGDDNDIAYVHLSTPAGSKSKTAEWIDFGFVTGDGFQGVPDDAEILGVEVAIRRYQTTSNQIRDYEIYLMGCGGSDNKADTGTNWPYPKSGAATVTYGGAADDWNAVTPLTPAIVKSGSFGVSLKVQKLDATASTRDAMVVFIEMRIYYRMPITGLVVQGDELKFAVVASSFLGLPDTPDSYSGQAGKLLRVDDTPDEIEFFDDDEYLIRNLLIYIDGGGDEITTGVKHYIPIPEPVSSGGFDIEGWWAVADVSGSIQIDLWIDSGDFVIPDNSDSITASAPVALSSAQQDSDTTLTGWSKSHTGDKILGVNVDSCTTITKIWVTLRLKSKKA